MLDNNSKRIVATYDGDSMFTFYIEKAVTETTETEDMIISGIASTTNVDHDQERMTDSALKGMANIINEKTVPLRVEHQKGEDGVIGQVFEASIDGRGKLLIKAKLNKENSTARMLYEGLKSGAKLGLSVGGRVKRAVRELAEGVGKYVKTFYDVILDEVSVTPRPANYDAWLFNKSIVEKNEDVTPYYESSHYERFLFENPHLDYISVIEKSIPNQAWVKVEKEKETSMKTLKKETTSAEMTDTKMTDAEKEGTVHETETESGTMTETTGTKKEMDTPALDQTQPEETKPNVDETAKEESMSTVDESTKAFVTEEVGKIRKEMRSFLAEIKKALDVDEETGGRVETEEEATGTQHPEPIPTAKEESSMETETTKMTDETMTPESTEKETSAETDMHETEKETSETEMKMPKTETEKETSESDAKYGEDYQMAELSQEMGKAIKKGISPLDVLVAYFTKTVDDANANFAKQGKRVPGFAGMVADLIRNNTEIQKSIKEFVNEPGQKRSISLGVPYMVTKDGQRYRLVAEEFVEKSVDKNAGFKSIYQQQFSSTATGEEIR